MPASAWSLPASSSDTGLAEHLRQPGPSQRAISDSAVLMPPPPLPATHTASAGKLANHPYMRMAQSSQPTPPSPAKPAFSASTTAPPKSTTSTGPRQNYKRMSADFAMPPPAVPAPTRPSSVSERRSLFEQQPEAQAQPQRADPIQKALQRASDPFALPVTHRRNSDKQEVDTSTSQLHTTPSKRPLPVPPSPTLSSRYQPPSPVASHTPRFPPQSPSTAQPTPRFPPQSPTMSQAPWVRPQSPSVPPSPRFAPPSVPSSPRPTTPAHRHSASISALPPPSPRTPGHKVSQSLSGLQALVDSPKKPELPSNPAAWNPSQLAQHLRHSLRSGADGQTLPVPVVEDVVTWILRHRIDGSGFLAGVEGIGGSRPPFLPVLSVVSRKLRRTSRAQRHAALPLPEDMPEEQTRVRRLAHAFESASEAEDDLHALRQQLTGNSIEGYGRATPRTTEKLAWQPRPRTDSIGSNMSDSRWELSPTKHAPVPIEQLLGPRLSLESAGQADDELDVCSNGVRSPSPESPLISPKLLFHPAADDVPPLSPSSPLGDVTHISNLSAVLSPSDLFSPERVAQPESPKSPLPLRKAKRVSSTKRLPSTFDDDETRKVTVTPRRRASRKRPSLGMSPAMSSPVRTPGSPLDVPSPIRTPGSPLRAESSSTAPSPLRAVDVPVVADLEVTLEPEVIEVTRAEFTEVTPEPELAPPVTLILPGSPQRLEREVATLQDRVRELEQRLASVTPVDTPTDTPVKRPVTSVASVETMTEDEFSFEKETFLPATEPAEAAVQGDTSLADAEVQAEVSLVDAQVETEDETEESAETAVVLHSTERENWEAEFARTELQSCLPNRLGLEASVAVQTSPLARLVTMEDEPEPVSTITPSLGEDMARSRSSSTSSMASTKGISRPLPKGWWHAFLSPDEAIPPMRDVPVLFFMAGMGVGVSFGAVVVRVMLGRKLLHG